MSERRASKSGFAKEAQDKINTKYDCEESAKCMEWIAEATGEEDIDTSGDVDSVQEQLKDGQLLLKLYEAIDPDVNFPAKLKTGTNEFKNRERIETFVTKVRQCLGIKEYSAFNVVDLYEKTNMPQVIHCLQAVARKSRAIGSPAGGFGPVESEPNKREFTDEQLAQGKTIIGGQMGSNKYATQSGQNFGKTRSIVD